MEKKFSFTRLFANKKFKYGGYSVIVTLVGIALIVLLNYGLTILEKNFDLHIDTTQNKKYSLGDQTKKVVAGLDKDIYIYTTYPAGAEDKDINEILQKIKSLSGRINLQNVDPDLNPVFFQKFETNETKIASGDVIVSDKDGKLFRVLGDNAQYTYTTDPSTYQQTRSQIKIEGSVVNAMNYIKLGYIPTVYLVQGHGEVTKNDIPDVSSSLSDGNYNLVPITIAQAPDKIKAGDIVMIFNPQRDITDAERDALKPLMQKGGRFSILLDPQYAGAGKMPNLESLLRLFDVGLQSGMVMENNANNMYQQGNILVPDIQSHEVTTSLDADKYKLVIPQAGALTLPDSPPDSSIKITSLLKTSDTSYLKSIESMTSAESLEDLKQEPEDKTGPFDIAAAIEKTNGSNADDNVKVVVTYSALYALYPQLISASVATLNNDLFMNGVDWMRNAAADVYVRPKSISGAFMNIRSDVQFWTIAVISVALIPVLMLVIGIVVYQRRKHL